MFRFFLQKPQNQTENQPKYFGRLGSVLTSNRSIFTNFRFSSIMVKSVGYKSNRPNAHPYIQEKYQTTTHYSNTCDGNATIHTRKGLLYIYYI